MRKVTREAVAAFLDDRKFQSGNTQVAFRPYRGDETVTMLLLHGNTIAAKRGREVSVSLAGWNTPTTRERVNGVLEALGCRSRFVQHQWDAYIYKGGERTPVDSDRFYPVEEL